MAQRKEQAKENDGQHNVPMLSGPGRPGGNFGGRAGRGMVVKPKNFTGTLKRLWFYLGKERKWLSIIFMFILAHSALILSVPYLIGVSVDAMPLSSRAVNFKLLETVVIALIAAYIADGLLAFLQGWLMAGVSQRIVTNLRRTLFGKLQKLPVKFFDSRPHGELMSRLSNDIDNE